MDVNKFFKKARKKKLLVFLLLLISPQVTTFQDDFKTAVIILAESDEVDEFVANRPYGYCHRDGLPMEYCKTVSIDLFGDTFQRYALIPDLPSSFNPTTLRELVSNFHLGIDNAKYDVPTPGQLQQLVKKEILDFTDGCFWIKSAFEDYIVAGLNKNDCRNEGWFNRLVTTDFPSDCPDDPWSQCGLGFRSYTIQLQRGYGDSPDVPSYRVEYKDYPSKELVTINKLMDRSEYYTLNLVKGATDVHVYYLLNGIVQKSLKDLDKIKGRKCFIAYMNIIYEDGGGSGASRSRRVTRDSDVDGKWLFSNSYC